MDLIKIVEAVNHLPEKEKRNWHYKSFRLFKQFESSLFLEEPYRLVIDSNIIMRFANVETEKTNANFLAISTFFNFFNSQSDFKASILIRPSVFYEFIRRRQLQDELDYWTQCKKIRTLIKKYTGLNALFEGLSTYEEAEFWINKIQEDETYLKNELKSILSKKWNFNFIRTEIGFTGFPIDNNSYVAIPTSVARESVKLPELNYFDTQISKLCLSDHILEKLVKNKNNNQEIISKYYQSENHLLHRIIKLRNNGELEGLADLDFLSTCNVNKQFQIQANYNYKPSSIPMTVDKNLDKGLHEFSKAIIVNTTFIGGEDEQISRMKQEKSYAQQLRIKESESKIETFRNLASTFWKLLDEKITYANKV